MEAGHTNSNSTNFYVNNVLRRQYGFTCKTKGRFTSRQVLLNVISLLGYLMDIATGVLVASYYYQKSDHHWAILTLINIIVPAVIIQMISITWHLTDGKKDHCHCTLLHLFLFQPYERFIVILMSGIKHRGEKQPVEIYQKQTDASLLCLFGVFLQSTHQIILQVYVMLYTSSMQWLLVTSVMMSLFNFIWTVAVYIHTTQMANDECSFSCTSLFLQSLSHTGIVTSRILSLSLFASVFSVWILLFIGIHWVLMVIWMVIQKAEVFKSKFEKIIFVSLISQVYCYTFFRVKEHEGLWLVGHNILLFCEMFVCGTLWYIYSSYHWYSILLLCTMCVLYTIGVSSTTVYYYLYQSDLLKGSKQNVQIIGVKVRKPSVSDDYQLHSTPTISKIQRKPSNIVLKKASPKLGPITSTLNLARRALLRSKTGSKLDIEFKPVTTPSQLSPIKATPNDIHDPRNIYIDCTVLQLQDNSEFHHFSVDASACFQISRCKTLEGTDINLSTASEDDHSVVKDSSNEVCGSLMDDSSDA